VVLVLYLVVWVVVVSTIDVVQAIVVLVDVGFTIDVLAIVEWVVESSTILLMVIVVNMFTAVT
jgi:hypothetical protein